MCGTRTECLPYSCIKIEGNARSVRVFPIENDFRGVFVQLTKGEVCKYRASRPRRRPRPRFQACFIEDDDEDDRSDALFSATLGITMKEMAYR